MSWLPRLLNQLLGRPPGVVDERAKLAHLIDEFISGSDRTMRSVGEIEGLMIRLYLDTEVFEKASEALSLYRPGVGAPYVDEEAMAGVLAGVRKRVSG